MALAGTQFVESNEDLDNNSYDHFWWRTNQMPRRSILMLECRYGYNSLHHNQLKISSAISSEQQQEENHFSQWQYGLDNIKSGATVIYYTNILEQARHTHTKELVGCMDADVNYKAYVRAYWLSYSKHVYECGSVPLLSTNAITQSTNKLLRRTIKELFPTAG